MRLAGRFKGTTAALAAAAVVLVAVAPARAAVVHRIVIEGPINPIHAEYVIRGIDEAERAGSDLVLLEMNTPGGLAESMEEIVSRMLSSRVPICAYVHPPGGKAASAGFFLLMSADLAAMAPGTRTGAAHPVLAIGGIIPVGEGEEPPAEKGDADAEGERKPPRRGGPESRLMEKVKQDARAYLRAIAARRGRNVEAAELAVTESKSYSDVEALEIGLIDLTAASPRRLLEALDGREVEMLDGTTRTLAVAGARIEDVEMTLREEALVFLTNPNLAFILLIVGVLLIYVEVTHAGMVVPGVLGAIMLLLAVMGFSLLPINVTGVILILASIGLFVVEIKVPGFGVFGVGGVICLALGGIILIDTPEEGIRVDPYLAVGAAIGFGGIALFLIYLATGVLKRRSVTGNEGMAGLEGEAITDLDPRGRVFLRGEYWDAEAREPIPKGARVRCVGTAGLRLLVEPAGAGSSANTPEA